MVIYTMLPFLGVWGEKNIKNELMALPNLENRDKFGELLTKEKLSSGAEVGVQQGFFSEVLLDNWPTCREFHLIDVWAHQKAYDDLANVPDEKQLQFYLETQQRLKKFDNILHYHRNYSEIAVLELKDESLDFIYLDARHDYIGVLADLTHYWPKLKAGGILAGHDYLDIDEAKALHSIGNTVWAVDMTGNVRKDNKAVKSAVNEFAKRWKRQVLKTTQEKWPSWYFRK